MMLTVGLASVDLNKAAAQATTFDTYEEAQTEMVWQIQHGDRGASLWLGRCKTQDPGRVQG